VTRSAARRSGSRPARGGHACDGGQVGERDGGRGRGAGLRDGLGLGCDGLGCFRLSVAGSGAGGEGGRHGCRHGVTVGCDGGGEHRGRAASAPWTRRARWTSSSCSPRPRRRRRRGGRAARRGAAAFVHGVEGVLGAGLLVGQAPHGRGGPALRLGVDAGGADDDAAGEQAGALGGGAHRQRGDGVDDGGGEPWAATAPTVAATAGSAHRPRRTAAGGGLAEHHQADVDQGEDQGGALAGRDGAERGRPGKTVVRLA
jgi:hypothetical protein